MSPSPLRLVAMLGAAILVALAVAASPGNWLVPALSAALVLAMLLGFAAGRLRGARLLPRIADDVERLAAAGPLEAWPGPLSKSELAVQGALSRFADELDRRRRDSALATEKATFAGERVALERLAAGLAGRFGEALAGARTALAAAEQAATRPGPDQAERFAREIGQARRALTQATALVDGLRGLAPAVAPPPAPSPLAEALDLAVKNRSGRAARLGVALDLEAPPGPLLVAAAPGDLAGAVGPLIDNALDALEGRGGRIAVRVEPPAADRGARIVVEDDGPGFTATALERAFDPFFSTRPTSDGLGLGLVFARAAAERCAGRLSIGARPGGGAQAVVELPPLPSAPGPASPPPGRSAVA